MDYAVHANKRRLRNIFTGFAFLMNEVSNKRATHFKCMRVFVNKVVKEIMINKFYNKAKYFSDFASRI